MDLALTYVLNFIRGVAGDLGVAERDAQLATETPAEWWEARSEALASLMDPADHPLSTRVGTAAGLASGAAYGPARSYEFGLSRVLDGLAALIEPSV